MVEKKVLELRDAYLKPSKTNLKEYYTNLAKSKPGPAAVAISEFCSWAVLVGGGAQQGVGRGG